MPFPAASAPTSPVRTGRGASTLPLSGEEAAAQVSRVGPWGPQVSLFLLPHVNYLSQDEGWKLLEVLDTAPGDERTRCPQEDSDKEEGRM